jgi:hypothetical protein
MDAHVRSELERLKECLAKIKYWVPRGRQLGTLGDVGYYITKLPTDVHETAEWHAAIEALILVAMFGGPTMMARIGVMKALDRQVERVG